MREIFDEAAKREPLDPTESARRGVRPQLRRRFYHTVTVDDDGEGYRVLLDDRPIHTPGRNLLQLPSRPLAEAVATEWAAQTELIDPFRMPLTRLVNTIIDGIVPAPAPVAEDIARYLGCDLLYYRADRPPGLVARQAGAWDPILTWAHETLGAHFTLSEGIVFVDQPDQALARANAAIPRDPWRVGALHAITTLTGSALLALAVLRGRLAAEQAWAAAHVDEDWNMDLWGRDELALARRAFRFAEMQAAATLLALLPD